MYAEPQNRSEVRRLATELYREKRSYLLSIARANATGNADAEEALQEAFIAFIRHFDPDRGAPPLAWLTLTLKRQCGAKRRKAHLDRYVGQEAERGGGELGFVLESIPSPTSGTEELAVKRDEARRRLGRLKPDQRAALLLQAAGFSYEEIGVGRGWSYTKVNRCVNEGRAALRQVASPV
jgi:DNA-directed RNA polymerase specialized sigma24 family protein